MNITDVRIKKVDGQSRLRAVASITIEDAFAIHELRIIDGKKGLFVAMPSRQVSENEFRDIVHPINAETRKAVETLVLEKYNEMG